MPQKVPYEITINASDNGGFTVRVGCKVLVFPSRENLVTALDSYLADPEKTTRFYEETYGWNAIPATAPVPPPAYFGGGLGGLNHPIGRPIGQAFTEEAPASPGDIARTARERSR